MLLKMAVAGHYVYNNPLNATDPSGLFCLATGGSASADAGLHGGVGGQGAIQRGSCTGDNFQQHTWATYGGFVGAKDSSSDSWGCSYPETSYYGAWGVNAGVGPGLTISNASGPADFEGPFDVTTFNVGLGPLSFSVNIATHGSTWSAGGFWTPLGSPINLSASHYSTNTVRLPDWINRLG
jgi:hypothetical protein